MTRSRTTRGRAALGLLLFTWPLGIARAADPPAEGARPPAEWVTEEEEASPKAEEPSDAAEETPPPSPERPPGQARPGSPVRVHHAPVSSSLANRDLVIDAELDAPHLVKALVLVYRGADGKVREVEFRRTEVAYRVTIPAAQVETGLAYAIETVMTDGATLAAFASRDAMQPVQLLVEGMDEHEQKALARLGGRRSVASVSTELADFGPTRVRGVDAKDRFWRVEGRYVYRPLRTVAEFSIRGGVVRGSSPRSESLPGQAEEKDVGLNYGAPSVRLRMADSWHIELEGLASVSDEGFSTGGGANLLIGDPYGSKLVIGTAFVGLTEATYFGSRFFTRVDLAVHERVTLSPIVEVTDMPNADLFGVRLLADLAVDIGGGFSASVNGGYQARVAASGGLGLGATAALAF